MAKKKILRSPQEILWEFQVIYGLEKKAARIYHQLSVDCEDLWVQEALEQISREECAHMAIASKLVKIVEKKILEENNKL